MSDDDDDVNDLLGHVVATEGLYALADGLKEKGWNVRARKNTAREGDHHLHVDEEGLFRFMTRPLTEISHLISGEITMENPTALETLEKLAGDFEALGIVYSLKVTDKTGAEYIHTFGVADE